MKPFFSRPSQRGSALLLVLVAIILLSVVILGVALMVEFDLDENVVWAKDFQARQWAESGIALGQHPQVEAHDPVLKQEINSNERFEVIVSSENSRLNINFLLAKKETALLRRLFEAWGLSDKEARGLTDCLQDWVDRDDLKSLNGAERRDYQDRDILDAPTNRPFRSLDEMTVVFGMNKLMELKPDWRDSFTIWGDGRIDVNHATAETLRYICNIPLNQAQGFVKRRSGPDNKIETDDDLKFTDMEAVRQALGMGQEVFNSIQDKITLDESVRRIESTGWAGHHHHTVFAVVQRNTSPPQYWHWEEK
jgi:general secretion pathway protein K